MMSMRCRAARGGSFGTGAPDEAPSVGIGVDGRTMVNEQRNALEGRDQASAVVDLTGDGDGWETWTTLLLCR